VQLVAEVTEWTRRQRDRTENAAIAYQTGKWDEHLVEESIDAPASANLGTRLEIGELASSYQAPSLKMPSNWVLPGSPLI